MNIHFALNHITAPRLNCRAFIDLAASLGCTGVELRNDLADKGLSESDFFDGEEPHLIGDFARSKGVRLLGLSEVYGFNAWGKPMRDKVRLLINQAKASGAESISLIPRNDAPKMTDLERAAALREALADILPMLIDADMIALVEPLGYLTSSLRFNAEAVEAIEAVGGTKRFMLVHDTFHYHLAGGGPLFAQHIGLVHISGVVDKALGIDVMRDEHRVLVDAHDRLGNLAQIQSLKGAGYQGAFSFEVFAPQVHSLGNLQQALSASMQFIEQSLFEKEQIAT